MILAGDLFAPPPARKKLRDYQRDLRDRTIAQMRLGKSVAVELPTAGGKGPVIADVGFTVIEETEGDVWICAHVEELVAQLSDHLYNLGVPHGIIAPWGHMSQDRIQVGSTPTIVRRLESLRARLDKVKLFVEDEGHHGVSATRALIRQALPQDARGLGFSATWFRTDGSPLGSIYDVKESGPSIRELEDAGWISRVQVIDDNPRKMDLSKIKKSMGDFIAGQLDKLINTDEFIQKTLVTYAHRTPGQQAMGFYPGVASAVAAARAFHTAGWKVAVLESKMAPDNLIPGQPRDRHGVASALASGRIQIVFQVGMAAEGTDWPDIAVGIGCRNTTSTQLLLQQAGRLKRPVTAHGISLDALGSAEERLAAIAAGPKPIATWLDMVGNWATHGALNADREVSLSGGLKGQERQVAAVRRCGNCHRVHERGPERCPTCARKYPVQAAKLVSAPAFSLGSRTKLDEMTTAEIAGSSLTRLRALMKTREHVERVQKVKGFKPSWINYELRDMRIRAGQSF